mmetsp:Transcript_74477/g.161087  ORF Transcript_74477/g.161087 Transcript_74477/m.161087 type:complete len:223 (-) Transcript_74477:317-985(-)
MSGPPGRLAYLSTSAQAAAPPAASLSALASSKRSLSSFSCRRDLSASLRCSLSRPWDAFLPCCRAPTQMAPVTSRRMAKFVMQMKSATYTHLHQAAESAINGPNAASAERGVSATCMWVRKLRKSVPWASRTQTPWGVQAWLSRSHRTDSSPPAYAQPPRISAPETAVRRAPGSPLQRISSSRTWTSLGQIGTRRARRRARKDHGTTRRILMADLHQADEAH